MKEMDDGARVWRVFNDESERIDIELVDGWISTLDMLFIFAGLFSAVIATFVTQTSQTLQQDYTVVTASLLTEMVNLQRAMATGGNASLIPHSPLTYNSTYTSTSRDVWLNGLWLTSLALTLATALMAGLIKQWLHYYLADIAVTTPKVRAFTRQYRYTGLIRWGVPPIIESLPVLMNTSLFLFFLGLILFTQDLSGTIGITRFLTGLTFISFIIYIGSSLLPLWNPQCPYRTSLSKVFSGLSKLSLYLLVRISVTGDLRNDILRFLITGREEEIQEDNRIYIRNYFNGFKLQGISKALANCSSVRVAESRAVEHDGLALQQDVIREMALNSTNRTVTSIAIQSLAALHAEPRDISISDPLFLRLRDLFGSCFQYDPSKESGFRITHTPSVVERYSRAMILFPDHKFFFLADWKRMVSFSTPPKDLTTAVLLTCAAKHVWFLEKKLKPIIHCILDQPPIDVSEVLLWHHRQFIEVIEATSVSNLYSAEEQGQMIVTLVEWLSPRSALTLQVDLLIHCLYACRSPTDRLEDAVSSIDLILDKPKSGKSRATLLRFITLLPDIAEHVLRLSLESDGLLDRLLLFLSGMNLTARSDMIEMLWNTECMSFKRCQPYFSLCMNSLGKVLSQVVSSRDDSYEWQGDVLLRIKSIINLHDIVYPCKAFSKTVTRAIFHWLLVLSLDGQNRPENAEWTLKYDLLWSLFPSPSHTQAEANSYLADTIRICCEFVASEQIIGLPLEIMEHLSQRLLYLLGESNKSVVLESVVLDCLDLLFRHFFRQSPLRVDPYYPMTRTDRQRTLTYLIDFARAQRSRSTHWLGMISGWRSAVDSKLLETTISREAEGTESGESTCNTVITDNSKFEHLEDLWDLRDILWIFETSDSNKPTGDPWDLQDVLWMFEKEAPLGELLCLKRLLQQLDKALDPREPSIDPQDVTWLFKSTQDESFPLG